MREGRSLWFKGLELSSKNRWEFCQLLLKTKANNKCFKMIKCTLKDINREEWIRTWMDEGRYKERRMDKNMNGRKNI